MSIGDDFYMLKFFQQLEFLEKLVYLLPPKSLSSMCVVLDQANLRAPLKIVRHLDRGDSDMTNLRIDAFRFRRPLLVNVIPNPAVVYVSRTILLTEDVVQEADFRTEMIKAMSWHQVDAIVKRFESLNPYDKSVVRDSILKLEDENFADNAETIGARSRTPAESG